MDNTVIVFTITNVEKMPGGGADLTVTICGDEQPRVGDCLYTSGSVNHIATIKHCDDGCHIGVATFPTAVDGSPVIGVGPVNRIGYAYRSLAGLMAISQTIDYLVRERAAAYGIDVETMIEHLEKPGGRLFNYVKYPGCDENDGDAPSSMDASMNK